MSDKIKIDLIEDNESFLEIISLALEDDYDINQKYRNAERSIQAYQSDKANTPEVILLDLRLPGYSGLEALPIILKELPQVKVIILSQSDDEKDVLQAIQLGASGYLLKSSSIHEVRDSVKTIHEGGVVLDPAVANYLVKEIKKDGSFQEDNEMGLTSREFEILLLLADGLMKKDISTKLHRSYSTIDTHIKNIYKKLNVNNAPAAINKAHKMKLL